MNGNHFSYHKYICVLNQRLQTPMPHGQAGTLRDQCGADGSGGQGEGGGTHRHQRRTRQGPRLSSDLSSQQECGPPLPDSLPFPKKPRIQNVYVTCLSYCNLGWPHKIFLGPDTALDWQCRLYCGVKLIYHSDGKLGPATRGQLIPHELPEGLIQPQRHKLQWTQKFAHCPSMAIISTIICKNKQANPSFTKTRFLSAVSAWILRVQTGQISPDTPTPSSPPVLHVGTRLVCASVRTTGVGGTAKAPTGGWHWYHHCSRYGVHAAGAG